MPTRTKRLSIQLPLGTLNGRRGRDGVTRVMLIASRALRRQFKRLTSSRRSMQLTTGKLQLRFLRKAHVGEKVGGKRLRLIKSVDVPLITDERERQSCLLTHWHQLDRMNIFYKLNEAAKIVDRRFLKTLKKIRLEAIQLQQIHLRPFKIKGAENKLDKALEKLKACGMPLDLYMPLSSDQRRILNGLPIIKPQKQEHGPLKTTTNLRQTYIYEYFNARKA